MASSSSRASERSVEQAQKLLAHAHALMDAIKIRPEPSGNCGVAERAD